MGFGCVNMGISSGCSDEYEAALDCQWIDVTDASDGYYWLTVATNWDEAGRNVTSPENDYSNNEANVAIRIQGTTVTKLSNAQIQQQCPVKPPPSPPPPSPAPPPYVDPNFNNSCFGGPDSSTEADNGVCNDGGPGANSDICAFGTLCAGSNLSPRPYPCPNPTNLLPESHSHITITPIPQPRSKPCSMHALEYIERTWLGPIP